MVLGGIWILVSDKIVLNVSEDVIQYKLFQNLKGLFFVSATALILYTLISRFKKEIEENKNKAITHIHRFKQLFEYSTVGILIIDSNLKILECNPQSQKILKSSCSQIKGCLLSDFLIEDEFRKHFDENTKAGQIVDAISIIRPDGSDLLVELVCFPFNDSTKSSKKGVILHDISKRVSVEKDLKLSIKEKEILLAEIHHRVKNNLAIISSLLMLQSADGKSSYVEVLETMTQRIKSIALIHELLYQAHTYASLEMGYYIKKLANSVLETHETNRIKIIPEFNLIDEIHLSINQAIPAGLIINELLMNVIKHAYSKDDTIGTLQITLKREKNYHEIIIKDDGVGLPDNFSGMGSDTLGMTLIKGLIEQLDATITFNSVNGTEVKIMIPANEAAA